jgi:pimeloyl-ACP methyl ester carboxylesterase
MSASVSATGDKYLDLDLGRTRFIESGLGEPIIMLHGMGVSNSANSFDPIIPELARNYRVLALDQLGFGKGVREMAEGPTFELILEHVREFMDALQIDAAYVVGHSMGGWMAARLAYQSPDRVKKLVLISPAGLNAKASDSANHPDSVPSMEKLLVDIRSKFREPSRATEDLVRSLAHAQHAAFNAPGALTSLDPLIHMMHEPVLRKRYLLHQRLPKIKMPTLVAWGEGDKMDPYPTWTREFQSLNGDMRRSTKPWVIPGARYVLTDTGHHMHWEKPEFTATLISEFLGSS